MLNSIVDIFVGVGSNLENPTKQVQSAFTALRALPNTQWVAGSRLYHTKPVGYLDQPDFINAVVWLRTKLTQREVLTQLQTIEQQQGRTHIIKNGPRIIDLDLLLYGDQTITEDHLTVPHPRMFEREFVLEPLMEIAKDFLINDQPVKTYYAQLKELSK